MTTPPDVLQMAREAAAKEWDSMATHISGYKEQSENLRKGLLDYTLEVRSAITAIMAERKKYDLLIQHFKAMQQRAVAFLSSDENDNSFVNDIIYALDGPEQRAAEVAIRNTGGE